MRKLRLHALRRAFVDTLTAHGGGPLGVRGVSAIVVGTNADSTSRSAWARLAGSAASSVTFPAGPRLELDDSREPGAMTIVFRVGSLGQAQRALLQRNIETVRDRDALIVPPALLGGIALRFIQ